MEPKELLALPMPAFHANIRQENLKTWAAKVRGLFKELNITGMSVTTPNHSMASSIDIRTGWEISDAHYLDHVEIEYKQRAVPGPFYGAGKFCPLCIERNAAEDHLEKIILAAFPDLDDRSDAMTDYFNYCFIIK